MDLLGEKLDEALLVDPDAASDAAANALQEKYKYASPEVKERVSKYIERGTVGSILKKANGHKCQICEALGLNPLGFKKPNGDHYIEAHHVMPVSLKVTGTLAASNVMTLCANHHRQMHYGGIGVAFSDQYFEFTLDGIQVRIARYRA